ncbi:RrF2 family transcriptional regulator [Panacagrimonas sp.]|uniref:RrF2 family transcriptional regulator n=1 Tax=Panacagrimonas sp. TaxID=2480088 RepID=UPI003B52009A
MKSSLYGAGAEYALHSLLNLAMQSGPASVRDLATFQGIPERYLAKLFTRLQKARLVAASEGVAGGFVLARPAARIRVLDVLDAVDPDRSLFACAEIRRQCALFGQQPPGWATSGRCQIESFMAHAERELRKLLATKTLADLGQELECKAPRSYLEASTLWFRQRKDRRITRRKQHEPEHDKPA